MSSLFDPAIKLANRMSFSSKLFTVVLIFLLPFIWSLFNQITKNNHIIDASDKTEMGVEVAFKIKPIALDIAKHRGTMAQYLNGATDKMAALVALEKTIDEQLLALQSHITSMPEFTREFERLAQRWQPLKVSVIDHDAAKSFAAHTELIAQYHSQLAAMVDHFGVELQMDHDQYYLVQTVMFLIPEMQELMGQLRGKGAGALTDKVITPEERATLIGMRSGVSRINMSLHQQLSFLDTYIKGDDVFARHVETFEKMMATFDDALDKQVLMPEQPHISNSDFFTQATQLIDAIADVDKQTSHILLANSQKLRNQEVHARNNIVIFSIICILLGCYVAMGILMALNASVKRMNDAAQQLKAGDFSQVIESESEDVIGEVSANLSVMVKQVSGLIQHIQDAADQVNSLSVELQSVTDETKTELDQQNNQTQQAASAATEMAATVRDVARTCVAASSATDVARDLAVEGHERVNRAMATINNLGSDVGKAKDIIEFLQNDVTEIGAVLEVIRSIAEQTNLLALNAAIEAARAGEQGRGFAVVADEVRSLAKRTQDSTAEIRTVIEKLQARAANAVTIILQSYDGAQTSVQSAASAGESLQQIVQNVEMLRDLNTQIATAAEQQAAVAEQMSRNTRELSDSAENILEHVQKTLGYSVNLRQRASQLLDNTMQFKT